MKRIRSSLLLGPLVGALALASFSGSASAITVYGTLDNFDVINDTGQKTHGFEIELDGISAADVTYTFGSPCPGPGCADPSQNYIRYGNPTVVDDRPNNRVFVRYTGSYDPNNMTWSATTPMAPTPVPSTLGHQCWMGGDPVNYPISGCEHFGVSLIGNPTNTIYRWLIADPSTLGALIPFGTKVNLPAPIWNVTPPSMPGPPPVVMAAIAPAAPEGMEFGDALWVKIFVMESDNELQPGDLVHLVLDDPLDIVPHEVAEIEWQLLQAGGGAGEQEFGGQAGAGHEAVTRRFEFYKYMGKYDSETHEALCDNPVSGKPECGDTDINGIAGVGDFIGAQNAAVNLVPIAGAVPAPAGLGLLGVGFAGLACVALIRRRK